MCDEVLLGGSMINLHCHMIYHCQTCLEHNMPQNHPSMELRLLDTFPRPAIVLEGLKHHA
jgi:hypothetical protein